MNLLTPSCTVGFACIAGKCRHSCCIGWEIGIDEGTLEKYNRITGPLGKKLRDNILPEEDGACFRLSDGERCPFLNQDGLCELILALGEESLCQICTDHPRFRNYFSNTTEMGYGLCCEEAARLTLTCTEPFTLCLAEEDGGELYSSEELPLIRLRSKAFSVLQDRSIPLSDRLRNYESLFSLPDTRRTGKIWAAVLRPLERMDPAWDGYLDLLEDDTGADVPAEAELPLEQFACYLVYRHLSGAPEDGNLTGRAAFSAAGCDILCRIATVLPHDGQFPTEKLADACRLFSSEIEYSEENLDAMMHLFE